MNVLWFQNNSWIRIFRTSEGNENWFEKWIFREIWGNWNYSVRRRRGKRLLVRVIRRFQKSGFHCSYFSWNLAYSLTSIDCLVKSKTYYRNSKFFLVRNVQENFETALCWAMESGFFQNHHKKKLTSRIISVSPEKFQKFLWLGGLQPPSPPPARTPMIERIFLGVIGHSF